MPVLERLDTGDSSFNANLYVTKAYVLAANMCYT